MSDTSLLFVLVFIPLVIVTACCYYIGYLVGCREGARAERAYMLGVPQCYVATIPSEDDENVAREMLGAISRAAKGASGEGDE